MNWEKVTYRVPIIKGHPIKECKIKNLDGIAFTSNEGNNWGNSLYEK